MKLRNLRLTLANVARTTNAKTMEVSNATAKRVRNEDGTYSNEIGSYEVECVAYRGDSLKIKFPPTVKEKIEALQRYLSDDTLVEISFIGLKMTAYALKGNDGNLVSGVSAKAEDFEIHVKNEVDFENELDLL